MIPPEQDKPAKTGAEKVGRGSLAKRRRSARQKAMQVLYQWDFDREAAEVDQIVAQFCELQNMDRVDTEFFSALAVFVADNLDDIDACIVENSDLTIDELDPVERAVLRVAGAELQSRLDIPYKVVVNEAVEVAKLFGADQGHKFVNGVVDKMAAKLRKIEYGRNT